MGRARSQAAGDLWTRVTLQQLEPGTANKYGERPLEPLTEATVWADVEEVKGREFWYGQKVNPEVTHGVAIRIWDGENRPRLTSAWQVVWHDVTFQIESVVTNFVSMRQLLQCREIVVQ